MFSLQEIFIDALWMIWIAGVLATLSYMNWYRSANGWSWRRLFSLPRMLIPLCVSMELSDRHCGQRRVSNATSALVGNSLLERFGCLVCDSNSRLWDCRCTQRLGYTARRKG